MTKKRYHKRKKKVDGTHLRMIGEGLITQWKAEDRIPQNYEPESYKELGRAQARRYFVPGNGRRIHNWCIGYWSFGYMKWTETYYKAWSHLEDARLRYQDEKLAAALADGSIDRLLEARFKEELQATSDRSYEAFLKKNPLHSK